MLRIVEFTAGLSHRAGGLGEAVRGLSQALEHRCDVRVLGTTEQSLDSVGDFWGSVPVYANRVARSENLGFSLALSQQLERIQPEIVHVHGLWAYPSWVSLRWVQRARARGEPGHLLVSPHGMLNPRALRRSRIRKRVAGVLIQEPQLRRARCLHALTPVELEAIRARGLRNPVCVIPNGVSWPPASPGRAPPWQGQIPDGAKVLLYLGRLHPTKNLESLLHAFRVQANAPDWYLVLAGSGTDEYRAELEALTTEHRIRFIGEVHGRDKAAAFAFAEAFVLPSLTEGVPIAVLEAWAHGLPVLMTEACNLPIGFARGAALRISPEHRDMQGQLADFFATDSAERSAMGARGQAVVREHHSWEVIAERFLEVYTWIVAGGPPPGSVEFVR